MKRSIFTLFFVVMTFCLSAVPVYAQITQAERDIIIEEILKRLDIETVVENMIDEKMSGINQDVIAAIKDETSDLKTEIKNEVTETLRREFSLLTDGTIVKPDTQQSESAAVQPEAAAPAAGSAAYVGPHVKFVNSYADKSGGSSGGEHLYMSEYYPNEEFTLDVVFENDGNAPLPANLELRHTGNVGEYTGHTESAFSYGKAVNPGERVGFSFAAHGSENIGDITFYFQLFDADTGNPVNGGFGSFFYVARP